MSELVTPLMGAEHEGIVKVVEIAPRGMVTLRGDLGAGAMAAAVRNVTGQPVPAPLTGTSDGERGAFWMSPDELLLTMPYDAVPEALNALDASLRGTHHLAADASDARVGLSVTGVDVREVLSKLTPADMAPDAFPQGAFRRTRLAQVPAAIWAAEDARFEIYCFRSVAAYAFDLLCSAAIPGSEVGYF